MKSAMIAAALFLSGLQYTQAQGVSVNLNTGPAYQVAAPQPSGYSDYYYYPQIQTYYDVSRRVYIYPDGTTWRTVSVFPRQYGAVTRYRTQRVVIHHVNQPWQRHAYYRDRYVYTRPAHRTVVHERYTSRRSYAGYKNYGQWKKTHKVSHSEGQGHGKHGHR